MDRAVIDINGIVGDDQAAKKYHGGPDRALVLYSLEIIEALQAEGHPISPGSRT
jgi:MOSC domain-containing protein YiiM